MYRLVALGRPTGEAESYRPGRIPSDVDTLCIIANRKPIQVSIWAIRDEIGVINTRRSVVNSLLVKPLEQCAAVQKKRRTILYVVSAIAQRV